MENPLPFNRNSVAEIQIKLERLNQSFQFLCQMLEFMSGFPEAMPNGARLNINLLKPGQNSRTVELSEKAQREILAIVADDVGKRAAEAFKSYEDEMRNYLGEKP